MPDADLSLAVPAVFFGSVGTAGQRCTSTRRLYLHRTIAPEFLSRLQTLYASPALRPGDPLDASTLLGPLHSRAALDVHANAIAELRAAGAQILVGGDTTADRGRYEDLPAPLDRGNFVRPTIAIPGKYHKSTAKFASKSKTAAAATAVGTTDAALEEHDGSLWGTERFAPVLLVAEFEELEEAIAWNNAVPQGLSSSLWTRDVRNVGKWIGPAGSDAGIVNVSLSISPCLLRWLIFLPCRSTLARAVQRSAPHSAGTRSVLQDTSLALRPPPTHTTFTSLIRAPGGVANLVATLGNNMYAGVRARSTFPTKHPSHRVSTLNRHEEKTRLSAPYSRVARRTCGESPAQQKMLHFLFVRAYCHGGEHYGGVQFYKKRKGRKRKEREKKKL